MKIMTVVGTRPEIIRLCRVIARLDATEGMTHVLVHTGQNYDRQLNEVFFEDLDLRSPDYFLEVDTSSLGSAMGEVLSKIETVIRREKPDAFLVLGDTNSCISALMAKRLQVPVYHMEAGNRCFDENVPEETNRRLVDHISDFNLAYTEHARRNLLAEGRHPRRTVVTGSPMPEVLEHFRSRIVDSNIVERLNLCPQGYFLVSAHREENVDSSDRLRELVDCLEQVSARWHMPVIASTHPRTRKRLEMLSLQTSDRIRWLEPFGFHDYNRLQMQAFCVLSDSGTISEESSILGFPAVTLRESIERPEALETGSIMMCGLNPADLLRSVDIVTNESRDKSDIPSAYKVRDTSLRTVRFISSTAGRHASWAGLRGPA